MMQRFAAAPDDLGLLKSSLEGARLAQTAPWTVYIWRPQNVWWRMSREVLPAKERRAARGDLKAARWVQDFTVLGQLLEMR
jgi:hypothetical protein